jgi:hydrogenase nickel incorporation protein HypB
MCGECGCGDPEIVPVDVHARILAGNDRIARHNQEHFREHGTFAVNLMGSPGSGKTALLEATAELARDRIGLAAVSGDLATDRDGERLRSAGIPAWTITTGSACHLDARMIHHALHDIPLEGVGVFFIENVGNLVCPAVYDLGQAVNVVAVSVTEGEDKPLKYPAMFGRADLVLLTKIDLLPALPEVSVESFADALSRVNPRPRLIPISARTHAGMAQWLSWLERARSSPALGRVEPEEALGTYRMPEE